MLPVRSCGVPSFGKHDERLKLDRSWLEEINQLKLLKGMPIASEVHARKFTRLVSQRLRIDIDGGIAIEAIRVELERVAKLTPLLRSTFAHFRALPFRNFLGFLSFCLDRGFIAVSSRGSL